MTFPFQMFGSKPEPHVHHFGSKETAAQEPLRLGEDIAVTMQRVSWIMLCGWLDSLTEGDTLPLAAKLLRDLAFHAAVCDSAEHERCTDGVDSSEPGMVDSEQENTTGGYM